MRYNRNHTKGIAMILCFVMLFSTMATTVFAMGPEESVDTNLTIEQMEKPSSSDASSDAGDANTESGGQETDETPDNSEKGEPDFIIEIASFLPLDEEVANQIVPDEAALETFALPQELEAIDAQEDPIIVSVTWEREPVFNPDDEESLIGYRYTPVLPEGYVLAEGVELPTIQVAVMEAATDGIEDTTTEVTAFLPLDEAALESTETSITYSISDDGKTLTFSGSGKIGTDVIQALWTDAGVPLGNIENVVIGEEITALSGYSDSRPFLYSGQKVSITIQGQGPFRFENSACKDLEVSLEADDRDSIEIGYSAFVNATLNEFPIDKITKVESSGLSRIKLPVKGTTLSLNLKGTADTELCMGSSALSYSKNCDGNAFTTLDLNVSGNVNLGNPVASGSNIFGDKFTSASIHLEDGAQLILNTGFGGNVKLETLTFTGSGTVYFQPPNTDYLKGNCLHKAVKLKIINFSGFSGEIQFADNMFNTSTSRPTSAFDKPILKEVLFGDGCRVTRIGQNAFNFCEQLETFDFSKVQGPIGERAFQLANLSGVADLSGVTAIGQRAFEGVEKIDWKNTIFPENLDSVQLEYSTPFKDNEKVWQYVKAALDNKFRLNQDGSYAELQPSENGWESSKYGEQNTTDSGSTQLTKSAKWTDNEKTEAAVEIQAAYAPNKQMDFVFVLDTSDSMRSVSTDDADMGKGYELLSKTADVVESLLTSEDVDSHVTLITFGTNINNTPETFSNADQAERAVAQIRNLKFAGNTNYALALRTAQSYVQTAKNAGRNVSVVFLSDAKPNKEKDKIEEAAQAITDLDVEIIGVLYKPAPTEEEKMYMNQACTSYYLAADTKGFNEAINRTIYDAFRTFTLTDKIGTDFQAVTADDITVTGGTFTLSDDGRTITWDLSGTEPYKTYSMTIQQKLTPGEDGSYKDGTFLTNNDYATLTSERGNEPANRVESPELSRITTGSLTVTKTVAGDGGDKTKDFHFTVTLSDKTISGKFGDMEFTDGVATFTLQHGESKTAENLPANVVYTVTEIEANSEGYTTMSTDAGGTITADGTAVAAFVNTKNGGGTDPDPQTGDLMVSKTVSGNRGDTSEDFSFTVTLGDTSIDGKYGDMTFHDGVAAFTLRHGQSIKASGLPAGIRYTVAESDNAGYTVTSSGETGSIMAGETAVALFNNHMSGGDSGNDDVDVSVKKVWKLDDGGKAADAVTAVLLRDGKEYQRVELNEQNGWTYTWTGLSDKYTWSVSEVNVPDGFTMKVEQNGNVWTITNDDKPITPPDTTDPDKPTNPDKPTEPTTPSKPDKPKDDTPQTGDESNLILWLALLGISGMGVMVTLLFSKRKYRGKHSKR